MRPYIKSVVNEVKFTYVAEEYKSLEKNNSKKVAKKKKIEKELKKEEKTQKFENTDELKSQRLYFPKCCNILK